MKYFCTLFDKNYLIKGLSMIKSLLKNCKNPKVFILCMDNDTKIILDKLKIDRIHTILLKDIEDKELIAAKNNRTRTEYCWTLASSFTWYVMNRFDEIDLITYLDADLLFYSKVEPIFKEISNASIAIIEHRFATPFKELEVNGRFCVEWNSFKRDKEGLKCLNKWRKQCLDWCYYKLENDKMGDQKYLDKWPKEYSSCHIIMNEGAGIAPWNYSQYKIALKSNQIKVNDSNLVFYHFHQFQIIAEEKFFRVGKIYTKVAKEPQIIYKIYEEEIQDSLKQIRLIEPNFEAGIGLNNNTFLKRKMQKLLPRKIKNFIKKFL